MANPLYLFGPLPNFCPPVQSEVRLKRYTFGNPNPISDVIAPESAYLKLTKEQAVAVFWRVKEWEVSWTIGPVSISQKVTQTFYNPDDGSVDGSIYYDHSFSMPLSTTAKTFLAAHLYSETATERRLVCSIFNPILGFEENRDIYITSTEVETTSNPEDEPQDFDFSRFITQNEVYLLGQSIFGGELTDAYEFDVAWKNDLLYWPLIVNFNAAISTSGSDGILFFEDVEPDSLSPISGSIPRLAGNLTNWPVDNPGAVLTGFKVKFHLPAPDTTIIELDLYDITEPETTGTKFNIPGFTEINIKPKTYWAYDPNDGGGPIYDKNTGEQLRGLP